MAGKRANSPVASALAPEASVHTGGIDETTLQRRALLGELGAALAHETRNSLTGIVGFSQLALRDGAADADQSRDALVRIEREAQRCLKMIGRFLATASNGSATSQVRSVSLAIENVVALVKQRATMAGVRVVVAAESEECWANADDTSIEQILINLVMNAVAVTPMGQQVRIETEATQALVRVHVVDVGPGVPAAHADRVFERFFTTKGAAGTGLGLSVSRALAEQFGGSLELDRSADTGARFVFSLPRAQRPRRVTRP